MKNLTTRPDLKRDLQILHGYKLLIEDMYFKIGKYYQLSNFMFERDRVLLMAKILDQVRNYHYQKLHEIINRNVKPAPRTVGEIN